MIVLQRGIAAFEKRINKMGKFSRWLWLPMVLAAAAYLLLALTDNNYYPEDIHFAVEKMVDYNQKSDDIHSFVQSFFNFIYDLSTSIIVRVLFIGMFILSFFYAIKIKSASHIFALTSGMAIFLIILSFVGENRQEDIPRKNEKYEFKKAWGESSFQSLKNLSTNLTERESNYVLAQAYLKLKAEPGQIVKPEHADYLKAAVSDIRHNESEKRIQTTGRQGHLYAGNGLRRQGCQQHCQRLSGERQPQNLFQTHGRDYCLQFLCLVATVIRLYGEDALPYETDQSCYQSEKKPPG